jgi:hypothetical protein
LSKRLPIAVVTLNGADFPVGCYANGVAWDCSSFKVIAGIRVRSVFIALARKLRTQTMAQILTIIEPIEILESLILNCFRPFSCL